MELEQFTAARGAIERPMLMEEEEEQQQQQQQQQEQAIELERLLEEAIFLELQQIETQQQTQQTQGNQQQTVIRRLCDACNRSFSKDHFNDDEWYRRRENRCRTCESDGVGLSKRFDQNPVNIFIENIFGKEEAERFKEWTTASPWVHVILDGQEDYQKEMNTFDRFLGKYPPFSNMCRVVDDETRLYPLQKAIILDFQWDEGVRQIFEGDEDVIGFPFPDTGLFPFQMAASVCSFELSFHILRSTPSLLLEKVRTSVAYDFEEPQPCVFLQTDDGMYMYSSSDEDMEDGEDKVEDL